MKSNKIIVDIDNPVDVSKTLEALLANLETLCEYATENKGIKYGKYHEESFIEYQINLHDNLPSYSELVFFLTAAKNSSNFNVIVSFVEAIMQKNKTKKVWLDQEMPMGLNASFALAYTNKTYISNFIDFLRTTDMNKEVYQYIFISLLEKKWGICNEVIALLAARIHSISGQWGVESHEALALSSDQEKYFVKCLLEDILFLSMVQPDLIIDGLETLDIPVNINKFNELFINRGAFSSPLFQNKNIENIIEDLF